MVVKARQLRQHNKGTTNQGDGKGNKSLYTSIVEDHDARKMSMTQCVEDTTLANISNLLHHSFITIIES